ncbi:MAG TPA: integrin alpha, partial [Planctomycetota bacterium]|nr:integrin alpha [Planctomycetota bacterium]
SGVPPVAIRTWTGAAAGAFGAFVAFVGDVDGDGKTDVGVGDSHDPSHGYAAGAISVYSGFSGALLHRVYGDGENDQLGPVSGVGDLDGDGFDDVAAGFDASTQHSSFPGAIRLYSGATGDVFATLSGDVDYDGFGDAIAGLGDLDGDGFPEIAVGAPDADVAYSDAGFMRVLSPIGARPFGAGADPHQTLALAWASGPAGAVAHGAAHVSGALPFAPGLAVVSLSAVSAPVVHPAFGTTPLVDLGLGNFAAAPFTFDGAGAAAFAASLLTPHLEGFSIFCQAFELNAPVPLGWRSSPGLELRFMSSTPPPAPLAPELPLRRAHYGAVPFKAAGECVRGAGDVDADGVPDLVIGAFAHVDGGTTPGSARVMSGATGLEVHAFFGAAPNDGFGVAVDGAGDVDGDGYDDVVVGSPYAGTAGFQAGKVEVFSGATGAVLRTWFGQALGDQFGFAVAGIDDVNADGFDDVVVGAPQADPAGAGSGRATVISGLDGAVLFTFPGNSAFDNAGQAVAAAGDVNGDGKPDILVGAPRDGAAWQTTGSGRVRLYSGATGAVLHTLSGGSTGALFGFSVAGLGDVDGDGMSDVAVGAPGLSFATLEGGRIAVYSGVSGQFLFSSDGVADGENFGTSVGNAGDVDGDGTPDVVAGAPRAAAFGYRSGLARVLSGVDGAVLLTAYGAAPLDVCGTSVDGAGDLDGDGFAEVVVGVPGDGAVHWDGGAARVYSIGGARAYGAGPSTPLAALWTRGPGDPAAGTLHLTGAAPGAPALFVLATAKGMSVFGGATVLLDPQAGVVSTSALVCDGFGGCTFPLDLRDPALAGQTLFAQVFADGTPGATGLAASNGLELRFVE